MKKIKHIHRWSNWWKVKSGNPVNLREKIDSLERLCLVCREIQSVGKVNKVIMGWAIMNRKDGLECMNAQMPIFWNRRVAQETADRYANTKKIKQVKVMIF